MQRHEGTHRASCAAIHRHESPGLCVRSDGNCFRQTPTPWPPLPQPPGTSLLLPVSWTLTFPGTYIGRIMQHLSFCVWLISLRILSSRFIYVVFCVRNSSPSQAALCLLFCSISFFFKLKKKKKQWNSLLAFFFPKQNLTWKLRNVGTHSREG